MRGKTIRPGQTILVLLFISILKKCEIFLEKIFLTTHFMNNENFFGKYIWDYGLTNKRDPFWENRNFLGKNFYGQPSAPK